MEDQLTQLKYPIGKFLPPAAITPELVEHWIDQIEQLPARLRAAVAGWSDEQLDTPYRPEGWTVRQLIHHIADSHINSYVRFKWSRTENGPTIKAYDEKLWAEEIEAKSAPVEVSLNLLDALHHRWVLVLRNMSASDLERHFIHPESGKTITIGRNIALYGWHSEHHLAHVLRLKEKNNW